MLADHTPPRHVYLVHDPAGVVLGEFGSLAEVGTFVGEHAVEPG